jgi:flagellar biogenesis protein FliO
MTFPDVNKSKLHWSVADKRLSLIIIGAVIAVVIFAIWLFFRLATNSAFDDTDRYLDEGCYSLNSKWICPNP